MRMMPKLILATDLDGTFLGGSDEERGRLYRLLEARRQEIVMIFVTGRDLPFIRELCAGSAVPWPDYVIGDVGTTVVAGRAFAPVEAIEREIAARWGDRGEAVRAMLADEPGLRLQPTPFRHRVSYYYDPARLSPGVVPRIEAAGFDALLSADTFLDVLPRGVSKGPTLLRLLQHLALEPRRVLVAGDTLNDLSLFETGLRGVAVGNSEPALLSRLDDWPNIFRSGRAGAAGICEAIMELGLLLPEGAR
jgi:sucrose-6F-phosphate phosphohydrolase